VDSVSIVDQAIQDRIGNGWIPNVFMPVFNRQLTGDE
jgi:hypothetical protein